MGLLKTAGRAAVASSVHGRVQRRQQQRWAAQAPVGVPQQAAPPPAAHAAPPPAPQQAAPSSTGAPVDDMLAQLTQLGELRAAGVLTDAEFEVQKARILGT